MPHDRQTNSPSEMEAVASGSTSPVESDAEWLLSRDAVERVLKQCTPERLRELLSITGQQSHVLCAFLKGQTDNRIARELDLSANTVGRHMDDLRNRLAVPCRAELMRHVLVRLFTDVPPQTDLGKNTKSNR